ncbi:MAG: dienelactone hydrolase family protein [Alphaproteobacteria bacterium GM7ARS4]|nr:dienelactone hydrolase family protein [Alphaproteobacteria bacterium GM7ARS4]
MSSLPLNTESIKAKDKTQSLVILLHGYGAQGNDLAPIASAWHRVMPQTTFLLPDAPFPCEIHPTGRQWFSLQPFTPDHIAQQAKQHQSVLIDYLEQAHALYHITPRRTIVCGFSQGGMVALHIGLTAYPHLKAILGYSCALYPLRAQDIIARPDILLIHGQQDSVVDHELMAQTSTWLAQHGVKHHTISRPHLGHAIDNEGIKQGARFIQKQFSTEHDHVSPSL